MLQFFDEIGKVNPGNMNSTILRCVLGALCFLSMCPGYLFEEEVNPTLKFATTKVPFISPCPCTGQPEGIVIPHPSDCRAFYTCLGGINVLHSKCSNQNQFFHPYIRSCVQRSTYVSFVPEFIPTKDVCKITAVFPAPAMEDFENCNIKSDETSSDLNSDEMLTNEATISRSPVANPTAVPELRGILGLFPWPLNKSGEHGNISHSANNSMPFHTTEMPTQNRIPVTSIPSFPKTVNCKLAKVVVHHFPGPCKADITCQNGETLTIDKCQSSLSLVQL